MKIYKLPENEHGIQVGFFNWVKKNRKHSLNKDVRDALNLCYAIPNGLSTDQSQRAKMEGLTKGIWDIALSVPTFKVMTSQKNLPLIKELALGLNKLVGKMLFNCPGLFLEMKFGDNELSNHQKDKKILFEKMGYVCKVCYSTEAAIEAVMEYLPFPAEDYIKAEY